MSEADPVSAALLIGPISSAQPGALYQQIVDGFRREVCEGNLKPGQALPSFRSLAAELKVSMITVKRAYEELAREGIIFRRQGVGTFVAERGGDASRKAKLDQAVQLMERAIREASEAGLNDSQLEQLFRDKLKSIQN